MAKLSDREVALLLNLRARMASVKTACDKLPEDAKATTGAGKALGAACDAVSAAITKDIAAA